MVLWISHCLSDSWKNYKPKMNKFINACSILKALLNTSLGKPVILASGEAYAFHPVKLYTYEEITAFETTLKIKLPESYKFFLGEVGACRIYVNEFELGVDFLPLEEIATFSSQVFLEMENPFPELLLFASNTGRGDPIGFDLRDGSKNRMSVFFHEYDPECWLDDTDDWSTFENWLVKLVDYEAEDDLP